MKYKEFLRLEDIHYGILEIIDDCETCKYSFFWTHGYGSDFGNASARKTQGKKHTHEYSFKWNGKEYYFSTNLRLSRKNAYFKSYFYVDGERKDLRLARKILKEVDEIYLPEREKRNKKALKNKDNE